MSEENPYTPPATQVDAPPVQSGAPGPHNYASLGERFVGKLIDGLIMIPISFLIVFAAGMVFTKSAVEPGVTAALMGNSGFGIVAGLVVSLIGIAVYIAIQWTFWNATSQSIGKKVMKTQIVNLDGTPTDAKTIAFNRYGLMALLSSLPLIGIIGLVNALLVFRKDRNCLHDDIAKTRVIKLSAPPQS